MADDACAGSEGPPVGSRRLELTGWGLTAPTAADVVEVRLAAEVDAALRRPHRRGIVARGLGRSYGDAAQNAGGVILDLTGLAGFRWFDPATGIVVLDAGVSLGDLLSWSVPRGWFVPVSPGTRHVTVGGAVAADIHGKNHHIDGSFCDHVPWFELHLPGGETRTVSADTEPEVFWATAGGMGLTGVITTVALSMLAIDSAFMRVDTERAVDLDDCMARMEAGDHRYRYSVAWIDLMARGRSMGRSVLTRGDHAVADRLPAPQRADPWRYRPDAVASAPPWMPTGALNRLSIGAFNELWFRKAPARHIGGIESIPAFFHPLDLLRGWNRIYGRRGFVQYQFVVPFGAEAAVTEAVEQLAAARCPSFLAVLKRFGAGHGMLSFPSPGWTLALDLPAALPGLGRLFARLDKIVLDVGGRLYLAKDSRMTAHMLEATYPGLGDWLEVRGKLDPTGQLRSDLGRRLGLSA